jgi:hypothetical protein
VNRRSVPWPAGDTIPRVKLKVHQDSYSSIDGVRVRLDDLTDILAMFSERGATVELEDATHEFESLTELMGERGVALTRLEITGHLRDSSFGRLNISFRGPSVTVALNGGDELLQEFYRIVELMRRRRVAYYNVVALSSWIFGFVSVFSVLAFIGTIVAASVRGAPDEFGSTPLALLFSPVVLFVMCTLFLRSGFGVRLVRRHEGGFWKRNRDQLAQQGIAGILGAVAGALITYWLTRPV